MRNDAFNVLIHLEREYISSWYIANDLKTVSYIVKLSYHRWVLVSYT